MPPYHGFRRWAVTAAVLVTTFASLTLLSDKPFSFDIQHSKTRRGNVIGIDEQFKLVRQFAETPLEVLQQIARAEDQFSECRIKSDYLKILLMSDDRHGITKDLCASLPTMERVARMYGPDPVLIGLDTCQEYQRILGPNKPKPRVAGLYHTATNALTRSFQTNIEHIGTVLTRDAYNVPWGKHMLPSKYKHTNLHPQGRPDENMTQILPIVIVRDPFFWMQAMCKAPYDAHWVKLPDHRCPNLWNDADKAPYRVYALTQQSNYTQLDQYQSMIQFWTAWNNDYLHADYPRLIVRFEDVMYRLQDVVAAVRNCIGMEPSNATFLYQTSSSKKHGDPAGVLDSLQKYASNTRRHLGLTEMDRRYANDALDKTLMSLFRFEYAPLQPSEIDLQGPFPQLGVPPGPVPDIEELK